MGMFMSRQLYRWPTHPSIYPCKSSLFLIRTNHPSNRPGLSIFFPILINQNVALVLFSYIPDQTTLCIGIFGFPRLVQSCTRKRQPNRGTTATTNHQQRMKAPKRTPTFPITTQRTIYTAHREWPTYLVYYFAEDKMELKKLNVG